MKSDREMPKQRDARAILTLVAGEEEEAIGVAKKGMETPRCEAEGCGTGGHGGC